MWIMDEIISLRYKRPFIYHLEFDDGVAGEIDFAPESLYTSCQRIDKREANVV